MRRRPMGLAIALVLGTFVVVASGLLITIKRAPGFYSSAACPADWDTQERASKLLTRVQDLKNDIRSKPEWGDTFGAEDLNCFFHENMSKRGGVLCSILPGGFHAPRIAIEGERLKFGFKYGEGFWSTIVWVELRAWLVPGETNVVAIELCDLRAGVLPVGSQSILDGISEAARDSNIEVTWYRNRSNPVGLFKFYADEPRPSTQILALDVKDGKIAVTGRSLVETPPGPAAEGTVPTLAPMPPTN